MTDLDLAAIKAKLKGCEGHTPEPWEYGYFPSSGIGSGYGKSQIFADGEALAGVCAWKPTYERGEFNEKTLKQIEANAALIILAPHIPPLVAEVERLQKRVAKLDALEEAGVDNWEGYSIAMEILRGDTND